MIGRGASLSGEATAYGEIRRYNEKQFVRDARYKLIFTKDIGLNKRGIPVEPGHELYDLLEDPSERHNLFKDRPEIARRLMAEMDRRRHMTLTAGSPAETSEIELSSGDVNRLQSLGYVGG